MRFEYLDHTADVKFRAYGDSLEKAFGNAALAMFNVMVDTSGVKGKTGTKDFCGGRRPAGASL